MKPVSSAPGMCHTVFRDAALMEEAYVAVYLLPRDSVLIEDALHTYTPDCPEHRGRAQAA